MRAKLARLIGVVIFVPALAAGTVTEPSDVDGWTEGPLGFLLTEAERERLSSGVSGSRLAEFAELFWARRDPNGAAPGNSFRMEFAAKVAAADEQFGNDMIRGALTARGRVLILLGVPSEHRIQPLKELMYQLSGRAQSDMSTSGWASRALERDAEYDAKKAMADVWVYTRDRIPVGIDVPASQKFVMFVFVDRDGGGVYELERRYQPSERPMRVLDAAPTALLADAGLTQAPIPRLLDDVPAAAREELGWLDSDSETWPEDAAAHVVPGVATQDSFPHWAYVRVPEALKADLLVGRVLDDASGTVLGTFRKAVEGTETAFGLVYEQAVPRFDRHATLEIALASEGRPVAVRRLSLPSEPVPEDGPYISPVYVGAEVVRQESFRAGAPFVFGGYHLLLRPDGLFSANEALAYFCLVVRPETGNDEVPEARVRMAIYGKGGRLTGQPYRRVALQEVAPDVYVFGSQLPLSVLEGQQGLRLKFWVEDPGSGVVRETEAPLEIMEAAR